VTFSIPTVDPHVWRTTEPGSPPPRQRLRALKQLVEAGIQAGVGMAPIIPGLSDRPEQLADVVRAAREAGATSLWAGLVYLRSGTREHFLEHLSRDWPEAAALCQERYATRDYAKNADQLVLKKTVGALKARFGIADRRTVKLVPPEEPVQLEIAV
jgi:DNA repair photolyase